MLRRAVAGSALAVMLVSVAVGCSAPPPVATPTPTVKPLFADDEAALAVAASVYDEYLAVRNLVESEGGAGVDRLAPLTSPAVLAAETDSVESFFLAYGMRSAGAVTTDSMTLVRLDDRPRADGTVMVVSLCEDDSGRTISRDDGTVLTRGYGATRFPYEVTIGVEPDSDTDGTGTYRIVARESVEDRTLCG